MTKLKQPQTLKSPGPKLGAGAKGSSRAAAGRKGGGAPHTSKGRGAQGAKLPRFPSRPDHKRPNAAAEDTEQRDGRTAHTSQAAPNEKQSSTAQKELEATARESATETSGRNRPASLLARSVACECDLREEAERGHKEERGHRKRTGTHGQSCCPGIAGRPVRSRRRGLRLVHLTRHPCALGGAGDHEGSDGPPDGPWQAKKPSRARKSSAVQRAGTEPAASGSHPPSTKEGGGGGHLGPLVV